MTQLKDSIKKDFDDKYGSFELTEPIYKQAHDKLWDFIDSTISLVQKECREEIVKEMEIIIGNHPHKTNPDKCELCYWMKRFILLLTQP